MFRKLEQFPLAMRPSPLLQNTARRQRGCRLWIAANGVPLLGPALSPIAKLLELQTGGKRTLSAAHQKDGDKRGMPRTHNHDEELQRSPLMRKMETMERSTMEVENEHECSSAQPFLPLPFIFLLLLYSLPRKIPHARKSST